MILIGFDLENMRPIVGQPEKKLILTPEEENLVEIVKGYLTDSANLSMLSLEKRSNAYTSLVYGGLNDFMRFKYTDRTKWVSLRIPDDIQKRNLDNPLFSAQKNKRQLHWKSTLTSLSDLEALKPFIIASCVP